MAATNFTPIQLYHSTTASAAPVAGNLANGELAINITDGKLFYKDNGGTVQVLATKGAGTIGGSNTQVQYNSSGALAGSSNFTFNGTTATINTLNLTNALGTTYGGTGLNSYTTGDIVYASASNTLSKLTIGTNGYILTSNGSIPTWTAGSSISVNTATNLAGGATGSVPYQSSAGATTFLSIGSANTVLTSSGTGPQWVTSLSSLTGVSSSSMTNTSLTSGRVVYSTTGGAQTDSASLTFNGTTLTAGGFATGGSSTLDKLVKIGDSAFNLPAVLSATAPAKLYVSTATVTDASSAGGATNSLGTITSFGSTTVAASNTGVTYTNLATLYIAGAPTAGTNVTITNPYALYVAAGDAYFGGTVTAGTVNLTTLDLTNLEVTNIKAKDGTASITLADSTGVASFTANPVLSGGTANGVAYLNGSKVLTTGSALTFDGTNLSNAQTSASPVGLILRNDSASTSAGAKLAFQYQGTETGYVINQFDGSDFNNQYGAKRHHIWLNNGSETMRLTSTGVTLTNGTVRLSNGYDIGWGAASTYLAGNSSSNVIQFVTNSAEIGRFTSAGMGVGTTDTSNGRINVVAGTGATGNSLFLTNVDGTYNPYVQFQHNGINGVTLLSSSSYGGTASNFTISIAGTPTATFNGNGNTGLRCVPSAWSGNTVLELFNPASAIRGDVYQGAVGGNNVTGLSHNAYFDGTNWKTIYTAATYYASRYEQTSGEHAFYIAGLTNGTISFTKAVTIDNSSRLLLATTSATSGGGFLQIGQVPNGTSSSIGFNNNDNAVISAKYSMVFQNDSTNTVGGRSFDWKKGGYGYGDGTTLMSLDSGGTLALTAGSLAFTSLTGYAQINNYRTGDLELVNRVSGNAISFYVDNGVFAMKILTGGDVTIGTTSGIGVGAKVNILAAGNALHVQSTSGSANNIVSYNSSGTATFAVSNGGAVSKTSGSFKIDHPLPEMEDSHFLVHSFVEGPRADNIYRGEIVLVNGKATVNIDAVSKMTEGTFVALNRDVQCFTTNETDWDAVRGKVVGNQLLVECQNVTSTATVSWMVIGERQDKHMYETEWTDDNGHVIVEPLKH